MAISAGTVAAALTLDTGQFDGALAQSRTLMETLTQSGSTWTDRLEAIGNTMQSVGKAATLSVTAPLVAAGAAATKTFATFDDAMRQVRATMNASEEDTAKLTAAAKQYGAETRYTASQAAEALNYLALAGYDADKSISALPTVLNLAQAGGMDLAYASDLVTDSMSALGLEMDQLTTFSDQLAVASQKSNTSISQLGQAILTVGGTAKGLKGGTVELNAELGILADAGIKSAEGGTHLRNVILSLQNPTKEGAELLAKYTDGVYDAEGRMRSLDEVFQELDASMASMTDAEKQNVISTIFNKTDLAAVQALLAGCGDRFAELTGYIEDSAGAAEQMADTMEGGIGGAFRSLSSAVEGIGIAFGETLAPQVQGLADMVTGVARGFASLDASTRSTIVTLAEVAAATGPVLLVGGKLVSVLANIGSIAAGIGAVMSGPAGWITLAVTGLALLNAWATRSRSSLEGVKDTLAESNAEKLEEFNRGVQGLTEEVDVDVEVKRNYAEEASTLYTDIYDWLTDGMPDTAAQKKEVKERVQAYYDDLISEIDVSESEELAKLQEQFDNGFIDYDTFLSRTAEVQASAEAARTDLGTLCDETLAFVENYAGKPTGVVQEAYAEIDALEKRTDELLQKIGLANQTMETAQGDTAVKLTKAGATGDMATYGAAFEYTSAQRAQNLSEIEEQAKAAAETANRIWEDAYAEAEKRGDQAGMERANQARDSMIAKAESERSEQIAKLNAAYVRDFEEMFAGIASRFPEQAAALEDAMAKIDLADKAADMLNTDGRLSFDGLSDEMISAMEANGVDVQALVDAMLPPDQMDMAVRDALSTLVKDGNIDIAGVMADAMEDSELGAAFTGMLEQGYLEGIEGIDLNSVDAQLALLTGHVSEYMGTSFDGEQVAGTWGDDIAQTLANSAGAVLDAGSSVGSAGASGVEAGGMNSATGKEYAGNLGDGLVIGLNSQVRRVRAAATRLASVASSAVSNVLQIKSPSRLFRYYGNMTGEGLALGVEDKMERVRASMMKITDPSGLGIDLSDGGSTSGAQPATSLAVGAGVNYNITVPGASIRSEDDAKELLKNAVKYTNRVNRGIGR